MLHSNVLLNKPCRKASYRLVYYENGNGCGKRVELESNSFAEIVALARGDHAQRDVDIFLNGKFVSRVTHSK